MKLRFYKSEGVVRSIGDPPNGIITIHGFAGQGAFAIDPSFEPRGRKGKVLLKPTDDETKEREGLTVIDAIDAFEACDNPRTVGHLWALFCMSVGQLVELTPSRPGMWEIVRSLAEDGERICAWLEANGYAREPGT